MSVPNEHVVVTVATGEELELFAPRHVRDVLELWSERVHDGVEDRCKK